MEAGSLGLSEEEFSRYVSGAAIPPGVLEQGLWVCDGLRLMDQNLRAVQELRSRQEKIHMKSVKLKQEMDEFKVSFLNNYIAIHNYITLFMLHLIVLALYDLLK